MFSSVKTVEYQTDFEMFCFVLHKVIQNKLFTVLYDRYVFLVMIIIIDLTLFTRQTTLGEYL